MRRDRLALAALLGLAVLFAAGLALVARERYTRGDGYPAGSSFRTDPLGTKALHDALLEIEGLRVARHVGPATDLRGGEGTVVLLLEVSDRLGTADPVLVRAVEAVGLAGGRIVVTLARSQRSWFEDEDDEDPKESEKKREDERAEQGAREPQASFAPPLSARWGFAARPCPSEPHATIAAVPIATEESSGDLPWRGGDCLADLTPAWRSLYRLGAHPVVAERSLGRGSIVLLTGGYVLSNEGLLFDRRPAVLSRLIGTDARTILFEESHHGVRRRAGIVALLGRYRMRGALAAAAILLGLWGWWAGSPLVPAAGGAETEPRSGKEASLGLVSLLRRGVPPKRLMETCLEEWRRAFARARPAAAAALARLPPPGEDIPAAYRRAREAVNPNGGDDDR